MKFDQLVNHMKRKEYLWLKYARLARKTKSTPRRISLVNRSQRYRRQSLEIGGKIRLGHFANRLDRDMAAMIRQSVIPVFREHPAAMVSGGTGSLFEIGGAAFFFTASHVFDAHDQGIGLYVPRFQDSELIQLTGIRARERNLDIAALRLDEDTRTALAGYRFLTLANIRSQRAPLPNGLLVIYGYPSVASFSDVVMRRIRAGGLNIIGHLVEGSDRFSRSSENRVWIDAYANQFDLNGISGSPIWLAHVNGAPADQWSTDDAKVIGIETSTYREHTVIEGTRIRHMLRMIQERWPELVDDISPHL